MPWRLMRLLASGTTCTWYSINSIPCHKIATTLFFWTSHIVFFNHYHLSNTAISAGRSNIKIGRKKWPNDERRIRASEARGIALILELRINFR